jgi:hypothetical protein
MEALASRRGAFCDVLRTQSLGSKCAWMLAQQGDQAERRASRGAAHSQTASSDMNDSIFSVLPAQTQTAFARISAAVENVLPSEVRSWPIDVSALPREVADSSVVQEVSDWAGTSKACLYYFECRSTGIDLASVERAFVRAKAGKANKRAYPRLNAQGTCFYVGS